MLFRRLRAVCRIAPYAWQFVVATMHPERSPAVLVVVLFWKELEFSVKTNSITNTVEQGATEYKLRRTKCELSSGAAVYVLL